MLEIKSNGMKNIFVLSSDYIYKKIEIEKLGVVELVNVEQ